MSSHRAKRQKKGKTAPPPAPMVPPPSNMEKDAAQAIAELLSGPGVARLINMDKASVNVPRTPPVGGVANMAPVVNRLAAARRRRQRGGGDSAAAAAR